MTTDAFLSAIFLGILEGLTEYLPVSSTGHLIVFIDLLGFVGPPGKIFEIVIQVGAVAGVVVLYARKLFGTVFALPSDPTARKFAGAIVLAFLPAAVMGVLLHDYIKNVLFSPPVVAGTLIVGGLAILAIERLKPAPRVFATEQLSAVEALKIGAEKPSAPGAESSSRMVRMLVLGMFRLAPLLGLESARNTV